MSKFVTFQIRYQRDIDFINLNVFVPFNQLILYHFPTPKYIWMEIKFRLKKCIGMWDKDEKGKLIENIFIQKIIFFSFF